MAFDENDILFSIEDIEKGRMGWKPMSEDELAALRELVLHSGWKLFTRLLDKTAKHHAEVLLSAVDDVNVEYLRGQISGMRKAAMIPSAHVTGEMNARTQRERAERSGRSRAANPVARALATFGTSSWGNRDPERDPST